jgi:hypothetical protein
MMFAWRISFKIQMVVSAGKWNKKEIEQAARLLQADPPGAK